MRMQLTIIVCFPVFCACSRNGDIVSSNPAYETVHRATIAENTRLADAYDFFQQNQYRAAITECEDAIAADENNAEAFLLLGVTYFVQDDIERGVLNTDDAFRLNPGYWRGGADDRALQYYNAAVRELDTTSILKPRYAQAFAAHGRLHERTDDSAGAIRCCTEAIRLNPQVVRAYVVRGNAFLKQDSFDEAFADYRRAVELKPSVAPVVADTCRRRGLAEQAKGNDGAAQQCLQAAKDIMVAGS